MPTLGRLEKVELREIWGSESQDFTPWLALPENIELLGQTIGIELELEAKEKNVGQFKADILCKNTLDNSWILIENQLERTDHTHLGQILTYAAGLNAVTIVWIAQKFTDEHRSAIDWLNEKTDEQINFFALEIELYKIGNSNIAPKFNIICKPNDWHKTISEAARRIEYSEKSELKLLQQEYWNKLGDYIRENSKIIKPQKGLPQHWANHAIGRTFFNNAAIVNSRENKIGVYLSITGNNSKSFFQQLLLQKTEIEKETKFKLEWEELPEAIESRIKIIKDDINPIDKDNWKTMIQWHKEALETIDLLFRKRIKELK